MTRDDLRRINQALTYELGLRACLHMEYQPRDLRWFRTLAARKLK